MQMDDGHLRQIDEIEYQRVAESGQPNSDLLFRVGEKVKVKGGDFKIKSMGKKMMVLEGLPGTRIAT